MYVIWLLFAWLGSNRCLAGILPFTMPNFIPYEEQWASFIILAFSGHYIFIFVLQK